MHRLYLATALALATHPALAIDCNRAKTDIEHAICRDAQSRTADRELGIAFDRLRTLLPDDQRTALRSSQIEWIRTRDQTCLTKQDSTALSKCLAEQSEKRRRFLEGRPDAGESEGAEFRPMFIFHTATRSTTRLSIEALKFTGSGAWQAKANADIDEMMKNALADSNLSDGRQPSPGETYSVELRISLPFVTPHLLSLHAEYSNYSGQAHPFRWSTNINIETPAGRELTFENSVDLDKAGELFHFCRSQVLKEKSESADIHGLGNGQASDVDLQEVADGTKKLSNWAFSRTGVEINYGDDAFGGYGQCMCTCAIPYSRLRPLMHPAVPLP